MNCAPDMERNHLTLPERAEAFGIAHDAAWSTVMVRPEGGWSNSYDLDDGGVELMMAHTAAHVAVSAFLGDVEAVTRSSRDLDRRAYSAALNALTRWEQCGCPLKGYEAWVPRLSSASARWGGGNPLQSP